VTVTERVARLRARSLETKPWLSIERAALLTRFYREAEPASTPVFRARAFRYVLEHKTIYIGPDELIVGERGPAPKGTPTYPELCCHSLQDFDILDSREKISYRVDPDARRVQRDEIIPFWAGRGMRDHIFR
jgi:pyruvate-formate lyase